MIFTFRSTHTRNGSTCSGPTLWFKYSSSMIYEGQLFESSELCAKFSSNIGILDK